MNYEDYVDFTICTNLDRRPERWEFMETQFERHQMEVHRIAGVDGMKRMPIHGRLPIHREQWPQSLTWNQGLAGAGASFAAAIQIAKYAEARTLLYLEDDAILPPDFKHHFCRTMEQAPKDWDIINFGPWHFHPPKEANHHFHRVTLALNIHILLIHSRAFDIILAALNMKKADADHTLCELTGLSYYSPKTFFVAQKVGFSDVQNRMMDQSLGRIDPSSVPDKDFAPSFMPWLYVRHSHRDADLGVINEVVRENAYGLGNLPIQPRTIIDAGAHIGSFAWKCLEAYPGSDIVCVEADANNLSILNRNISHMSPAPQVLHRALSYREGPLSFRSSVWPGTWSTSMGRLVGIAPIASLPDMATGTEQKVDPVTIEAICDRKGWKEVDLLKLDIEGGEIDVLQNLPRSVKMVIGEFHDIDEFDMLTLHQGLKDYKIQILHRERGGIGKFMMIRKDVFNATDKS